MLRFFPAAGERNRETGLPQNRGRYGCYWTSSANNATSGWTNIITIAAVHLNVAGYAFGYSVRCVAQKELVTTCCF